MNAVRSFIRRTAIAVAMSLVGAGMALADAAPVKVLLLGDDTLVGLGISNPADRLPNQLQAALTAEGKAVEIVEASSHDTTSKGGVIWLKSKAGRALMAEPARNVVVLALGHLDCGALELAQTKANLDKVLAAFAEKHIPVLLVATKARPYCGAEYRAAFPSMFPELAQKYGVLLCFDPAEAKADEMAQGPEVIPTMALDAILPSVRQLLAQVP